jgi:hypothetical protein
MKRSVLIDRANKSLVLMRHPQFQESEPHCQPLDKELLESGWKDTVRWLRVNKIMEPEPPHIWGTIIDRPIHEASKEELSPPQPEPEPGPAVESEPTRPVEEKPAEEISGQLKKPRYSMDPFGFDRNGY